MWIFVPLNSWPNVSESLRGSSPPPSDHHPACACILPPPPITPTLIIIHTNKRNSFQNKDLYSHCMTFQPRLIQEIRIMRYDRQNKICFNRVTNALLNSPFVPPGSMRRAHRSPPHTPQQPPHPSMYPLLHLALYSDNGSYNIYISSSFIRLNIAIVIKLFHELREWLMD